MFGKLMKYELRGCMRIFLPLWGAVLALALYTGLTAGFQPKVSGFLIDLIVHILPGIALVGLSFGMFVVALVLIIRRFYSGLLGEGGVLAFSLPVTVTEHIFSKLLTALIMTVGCVLAGMLASVLAVIVRGYGSEVMSFLQQAGRFLAEYPKTGLLVFEFIVMLLLFACFTVLRLYSGIAVGHLFPSHRGLWSVAAVIGIGWILNFVSIGLVRLFSRGSIEISINTVQEAMAILPGFFGGIIVYLLVWNVLMWLLTWIILKKRLNIL